MEQKVQIKWSNFSEGDGMRFIFLSTFNDHFQVLHKLSPEEHYYIIYVIVHWDYDI